MEDQLREFALAMCLHRSVVAAALGVAAIVSAPAPAQAQSAPPRPGSIDVRAFMPGLHADRDAPASRSRGGLTTEARMATALHDRDLGALRSAGEAADVQPPRPARTVLSTPAVATVPASAATSPVATTASAAPL